MKIAVIIGSLRKESYNRQLAQLAISQAPEGVEMVEVQIANLPFFDQDLEDHVPQAVASLKQAIAAADGVLIISPEYNRSVPGMVKNAVDWASRPDKESVWSGKPVGIMGASNGQFGTITAQFDLRRILTHTNSKVMTQPQVYVARAQDKLDQGNFDEATTKVVGRFMHAFADWVKQAT